MGVRARNQPSGAVDVRSFWPYLVLAAGVAVLVTFSLWLPGATSQATSPPTAVAAANPTLNPTVAAIAAMGTPRAGQPFSGSGTFQGDELQVAGGPKVRLNGRYGADGEFGVVRGSYAPDMSVNVEAARVFGERKEMVGKPVPEIAVNDFKLSALRGKKVLVYFAASPG